MFPNSVPAFALAEVAAFMLAAARVAGFVVTSPFPGRNVPTKVKIALVLLMAWVGRAAFPGAPHFGLDLHLLGLVPSELGIGLLMGFTVRITFSAAEVLGTSVAQATGLTMGQVYDPALGTEDPIPSRMVTLFAMLLFLTLGAHRVAIGYALESFRALPIGQGVSVGAGALSLFAYIEQAMDTGVRLALPVMAVALVVQVALALIARASPSLQVFSVGMGISVAAGLLAIIGSLSDAASGLAADLQRGGPRIEQVLGDVVRDVPHRTDP